VIIGDNSVGKSLILHKITEYRKLPSTSIRRGYEKYLKENNVDVQTKLPEYEIFRYDSQGEVRQLFEEGKLKASEFLQPYFPQELEAKLYRLIIEQELEKYYESIQSKFKFDRLKGQLASFNIILEERSPQSVTFIDTLKTSIDRDYQLIQDDLSEIISKLSHLEKRKKLDKEDIEIIKGMRSQLRNMYSKYEKISGNILRNNKKINVVKTCINNYKKKYEKQVTDEQKIISSYYEDISATIQNIVDVVSAHNAVTDYNFTIPEQKILPNTSDVYQYRFISKLNIEEISNSYIGDLVSGVLKKGKKISTKTITQNLLKQMIQYYPEDGLSPLDVLKEKIAERLNLDFSIKHSIILNNMDVYNELSDGLNAQIYFTLIAAESRNKGIYIIDQPEDHVSPKAIKEYLLDQFKDMGENRQIIMVTHNPQFIVNLDVDNVIFLIKDSKHTLKVFSGALEYESDDYNVLNIIAENIEGGLKTISRRIKRYEKGLQPDD
jgi:hypothetical protein